MAKIEHNEMGIRSLCREWKEFDIWFSQDGGRLIVAMAEEIRALHYDRRRWKDVLRNSPTMHMELKEEGEQLIFEKFTVDCRKEGQVVTGEIVRYREIGVPNIRTKGKAPSGWKVTIWHMGDVEAGFS